jgi:Coenzyme PQQ synthesis protein D (PqqD)
MTHKLPAEADMPVRRQDVEWVELDGEVVTYDPETETLHRLNGSAARVWTACDGSMSIEGIAHAMQARFTGSDQAIDRDVRHLIRRFQRLRLLDLRAGDQPEKA